MGLISKIRGLVGNMGPRRRARLVLDSHLRVGNFALLPTQAFDLDKEELSRRHVLGDRAPSGQGLRFLDVGGRDGRLSYLLGFDGPLHFNQALYDRNKAAFAAKYDYFGVDLIPAGDHVLSGDLCGRDFLNTYPQFRESFDIVYSNNVMEHFARPWIAAENLLALLKPGGVCITIVPFAQRYHESPGDYIRYTPQGVISLFESAGAVTVLEAGFDIKARRYDWQGSGEANDIVPVDRLGAWRETWLTCVILRKQ
jgi:SAM-dependent methyltransferase